MKKLLLILLCVPLIGLGQNDTRYYENGQSISKLPTESTKVISEDVVKDTLHYKLDPIPMCGTDRDRDVSNFQEGTEEKSNIEIYTLYIIIFVIVIIIIIRSQLRKIK